jgi:hypothetical protein
MQFTKQEQALIDEYGIQDMTYDSVEALFNGDPCTIIYYENKNGDEGYVYGKHVKSNFAKKVKKGGTLDLNDLHNNPIDEQKNWIGGITSVKLGPPVGID